MACCILSSRINHLDDSQKHFLVDIRGLSAILVLGLIVGQQNGGWEWRSSALSAEAVLQQCFFSSTEHCHSAAAQGLR
jgi:hypothetical protein